MPRKVFFSFHYEGDNWRASQVRNIGSIEGNSVASDNDWETVKKGGDKAIQQWIDAQIQGRSCGIVLIGSATASRPWIKYEIKKCWDEGKGLLGIYVHNLKDQNGNASQRGKNPFTDFTLKQGTVNLSNVVKAYDSPYFSSTDTYAYIKNNLESWIESAIQSRASYE